MPGYEQIESLKNGGSWGKFWWKTCGFEWVNALPEVSLTDLVHRHIDIAVGSMGCRMHIPHVSAAELISR